MNQPLKQKVINQIAERRDEIINLCSENIKIPSENPPGVMRKIAAFIREYLEERDLKIKEYKSGPGRINPVSTVRRKKPDFGSEWAYGRRASRWK